MIASFAKRPDLLAIGGIAVAWLVVLLIHLNGTEAAPLPGPGPFGTGVLGAVRLAAAGVPMWTLMVLATMLPAALPAVRHVAITSLRSRRSTAVGAFIAGYLAVWILFGIAAMGLVLIWRSVGGDAGALAAAAAVLAVTWQFTPDKRRALSACQRAIPLPPRGIRASVACARFGAIYGTRCVQSCWAMMFLMAAGVGAHLPATLLISSVILGERKVQRFRPMPLPVGLAFGIAVLMVMFAGSNVSTTVPWLCRIPTV